MKIAVYVPSWPPGFLPNGIVTYSSYLVPALRQLGHRVFVLTSNTVDASDDPDIIDLRKFTRERRLWDRLMYKIVPDFELYNHASKAIASAVRHLVAHFNLDVFEIEESFGWSFAVSRLNIVPVVVRLHGPWFLMGQFDGTQSNSRLNRRREAREGRGIGNAHYVTANCNDTLKAVRARYRIDLPRSRVIPNPIIARPEQETWRIGSCDISRILFVGRFDNVKGGDVVLRAFGRLASSHKHLRLTFVGPDRGIETNGRRYSFSQFVAENLPEAVRSQIDYRGQVKHADVMSMRTQHFMTVIATKYDTMGYMMTEAMALGCPIISTAVGGIPEYIKDQRNGLLIPSQDPDAMAAACDRLFENSDLAATLGHQAWIDCRDFFNPGTVAKQMISVYSEAIDLGKLKH